MSFRRYRARAIQQLYTRKLSNRASSTVAQIHLFFHVVLENAVKLGILPRNPSDSVDTPSVKSKEFTPLSDSQVQTLITALSGDKFEAIYVLAVSTGMRAAELLGLTWNDIDWTHRLVRVEQTLKRHDGIYELRRTKSRAGRRKLPLPDYAARCLTAWRSIQREFRDLMGPAWGDSWDLVFTTPAGMPVNYNVLLHHFQLCVCKHSGLSEKTRVHDLRHTFATLLLERGVHIKDVSELLGHSSVEITLRVYGHVTPRMQDTAVTEINALLPAAGVAEAVAGELAVSAASQLRLWASLDTAIATAIARQMTQDGGITAKDVSAFDSIAAAFEELQVLIAKQRGDIDGSVKDLEDEAGAQT